MLMYDLVGMAVVAKCLCCQQVQCFLETHVAPDMTLAQWFGCGETKVDIIPTLDHPDVPVVEETYTVSVWNEMRQCVALCNVANCIIQVYSIGMNCQLKYWDEINFCYLIIAEILPTYLSRKYPNLKNSADWLPGAFSCLQVCFS